MLLTVQDLQNTLVELPKPESEGDRMAVHFKRSLPVVLSCDRNYEASTTMTAYHVVAVKRCNHSYCWLEWALNLPD